MSRTISLHFLSPPILYSLILHHQSTQASNRHIKQTWPTWPLGTKIEQASPPRLLVFASPPILTEAPFLHPPRPPKHHPRNQPHSVTHQCRKNNASAIITRRRSIAQPITNSATNISYNTSKCEAYLKFVKSGVRWWLDFYLFIFPPALKQTVFAFSMLSAPSMWQSAVGRDSGPGSGSGIVRKE